MSNPSRKSTPALQIRTPAQFAAAFAVSRETLARLETYEVLLRRWQAAVNLVANSTLDAVWQRHFADSAQLLALAPGARTWLDLGSGGGFPGLLLAILLADDPSDAGAGEVADARIGPAVAGAARPGSVRRGRVVLIESDTRKCAFLREVARQTGLAASGIAVDILSTRIETAATQSKVAAPDVVTARALAPLDKLLALAAPFVSAGTIGLFLKGREAANEVEAARKTWMFKSALVQSRTNPAAQIVRISALEPNRKEPCS
jgi:16S rRNA (guanine527-N7)-methyltransferase